jgi:hypothetical protein
MTSLDADSKHVKEVTKELQSQLDAVQGKLTEFKGLKDDVKTLKEKFSVGFCRQFPSGTMNSYLHCSACTPMLSTKSSPT